MKKIELILFILLSSFLLKANDTTKVNTISVGIGLSTHSLIDVIGEYTLPILNKQLNTQIIFSGGKINLTSNSQQIFTGYLGFNYYFFKPNAKLFVGTGIGFSKEKYQLFDFENYYNDNFELKQADLLFEDQYLFLKFKTGYKFNIKSFSIVPEFALVYRNNVTLLYSKSLLEDGTTKKTKSEIKFNKTVPEISIKFLYCF